MFGEITVNYHASLFKSFIQAKRISCKSKASLRNNKIMGKINKILEKRYRQCVDSRGVQVYDY